MRWSIKKIIIKTCHCIYALNEGSPQIVGKAFLKKVADYIGSTSPSFTAFTYFIFLRYRTNSQSTETIFDQTGDKIFAHAIAILI